MTVSKRLYWPAIAGIGLVLVALLAALFARSRTYDPLSYFENIALVREVSNLDAHWELDVLKSRMGIDSNYDALVDPLSGLVRLQDSLRARISVQPNDAVPALTESLDGIAAAMRDKTRLIERFKSRNAVLRNSLAFLPTVGADLRRELEESGTAALPPAPAAAIHAILLDTMIYSRSPSSDDGQRIAQSLARLPAFPGAAGEARHLFEMHVRTVLREQLAVDDLLRGIAAVPTAVRIGNLERLLGEGQLRAEQRLQQDRRYLLAFAIALLALLLSAAVKLIRNHALIKRVNQQLTDINAELERRVEARTRELSTANRALVESQAAVRSLLDNADQGFLTISPDLTVGAQYSAACEDILGAAPSGGAITEVLQQWVSPAAAGTMRLTLDSVFRDTRAYARELKLGLLPSVLTHGGITVRASYKFLEQEERVMLILTDATEATQLAEAVERERHRLEMMVAAFTEADMFGSLVAEYRRFLADELPALMHNIADEGSGELYRRIHTYKGLLAQFSFHLSPKRLHDLESNLAERKLWSAATIAEAVDPDLLADDFDADLESLNDVLGADFAIGEQRVSLSHSRLQAMRQSARRLLTEPEGQNASLALRRLLLSLTELGNLDVKAALVPHGRGAAILAERLEKLIRPVVFEGDEVGVPPQRHGAFLRSLVHVFRNAVDHGIESPDERIRAGKPADGAIQCRIGAVADGVEICIRDDGRGIDRPALEAKLFADGWTLRELRKLSMADLVFREGLSSRGTATEISGRGVGLAAVKGELDRLGGEAIVETEPGSWTQFRFRLPLNADAFVASQLDRIAS